MESGEQAEAVSVQDRPADDAEQPTVAAAVSADASAAGDSSDESADDASAEDDSEEGDSASADGASADGASGGAKKSRSRASIKDLEEEGEVAADYLEEFLDIVDVDGDIDIDVENGRASVAIISDGGSERALRRFVGTNGEVLEALQELTRLAVQANTGERSRLMLDVAGYRAQRRAQLTEKATKVCQQVKDSGKSVAMEPMSAFERKIVHDVVAEAGLTSESEGVDPNRHVVVLPAEA